MVLFAIFKVFFVCGDDVGGCGDKGGCDCSESPIFSLVPNVASFWDAALAPWHICSSSMVIPFLSVKCLYGVAAILGRNSAVVYVYCGDT